MTGIDSIILIVLGGFVLAGFWFGFIHMLGGMIGYVLGAVLAGRFYEPFSTLFAPWLWGNANLARIVAFFVIFVFVNRLIGVAVFFLDKALNLVGIIPFVKTFNRLLGAGLGLIEGTLVIGLAVYFAGKFPVSQQFAGDLGTSVLAKGVNAIGSLLAPLLPAAIQMMQSAL
ncbi:CvpA family protein [Candidatus Uhrbacteria bacterium]|nr:CvpA family protein [Candidatus Uhrbacteria bacterium]